MTYFEQNLHTQVSVVPFKLTAVEICSFILKDASIVQIIFGTHFLAIIVNITFFKIPSVLTNLYPMRVDLIFGSIQKLFGEMFLVSKVSKLAGLLFGGKNKFLLQC